MDRELALRLQDIRTQVIGIGARQRKELLALRDIPLSEGLYRRFRQSWTIKARTGGVTRMISRKQRGQYY